MIVEEAIEIIEQILDDQSLNKVQEIVLRQAWEGKSYAEIAINVGYDSEYIKQVGFELWRSLSLKLAKKVTKNNFQQILQRYATQTQTKTPKVITSKSFKQNESQKDNYASEKISDREKTVSKLENALSSTVAAPFFPEYLHQDWGDAPDVSTFYGWDAKLLDLEQWIICDRCRLVTILGQEGAGKTVLCAKVAEKIQEHFDYVIWRSLRNTPPIQEMLTVLIKFFSHKREIDLPESIDEKIFLLLNYLRFYRCLIVLDNVESILQNGEFAGQYRARYEGYGQLFRCIAETRHQSCLMLTSRQKLKWLAVKESKQFSVRSLSLMMP